MNAAPRRARRCEIYQGETDDGRDVAAAVAAAKLAGLDVTYTYGEYPDHWPATRRNHAAWAESAQ